MRFHALRALFVFLRNKKTGGNLHYHLSSYTCSVFPPHAAAGPRAEREAVAMTVSSEFVKRCDAVATLIDRFTSGVLLHWL